MSQKYPITISSWTLGDQCPFEERVSAAKEAGFEGIGLRAETYVDALNEGLFDADILAILDKYGMKVTEVEYIVQWAEEHRSYEQKYKEQICFHMCELFGVNHINCGLMENYSVEHTAQKLRELCHRAGKYTIGVEPMPYSGLPDIKKAWAVVKASGCDNAKLILDSWHWVRAGQPYDQALLADIPAEKIVAVQINDVQAHPYAKSILRDESMHDRMLPGTGYGDTAGFVKMLRDKGIQPAVMGVEVISDEILAAGVAAAAIQLPDGRIVTGKTSSLLGACSACILNALKTLAGIPDDVLLLSPEIIRPLQHLKVEHLGNKNPRLHVNEALIALAVCAVSDPVASRAMEALNDLAGSEAHATVILARADENTLSKLKINLTCEPKYETHKLYHG